MRARVIAKSWPDYIESTAIQSCTFAASAYHSVQHKENNMLPITDTPSHLAAKIQAEHEAGLTRPAPEDREPQVMAKRFAAMGLPTQEFEAMLKHASNSQHEAVGKQD